MCLFKIKLQVEKKKVLLLLIRLHSTHYMPINKKHIAVWVGRWWWWCRGVL